MKKLIFIAVLLAGAYFGAVAGGIFPAPGDLTSTATVNADQLLASAYENQRSGIQVQGAGEVIRVLPDDNDGSRHQRFIVRLASGQTLLLAHNIDLASRVASLEAGDYVEFNGEYEWNPRGGVIHWTHHDPQGRHETGWIRHKGRTYR